MISLLELNPLNRPVAIAEILFGYLHSLHSSAGDWPGSSLGGE